MLVLVCKAHSVIVPLLVTIKVVGIKVENHTFGLFSGSLLLGSLFSHRLFSGCFLLGNILCYRLFSRCFLCGNILRYGLFSGCLLCGNILRYGLFSRCFLYGSILCYGLFCGRFHSRLFSLLLRFLFSKALLYLFKKIGGVFSSAASLLLFLSDLFLDGLASGSLFFFLFLGNESLLFSLLTSLSRSHRTLFGILFELLSVVVSIFKGCKSFLMQAL